MKTKHCDKCREPLLIPRGVSPLIHRCIVCGGAYHINTRAGYLKAAIEIIVAVAVVCGLLTMCAGCVVVVRKNSPTECSIPREA